VQSQASCPKAMTPRPRLKTQNQLSSVHYQAKKNHLNEKYEMCDIVAVGKDHLWGEEGQEEEEEYQNLCELFHKDQWREVAKWW
jgi:hypothetical protein